MSFVVKNQSMLYCGRAIMHACVVRAPNAISIAQKKILITEEEEEVTGMEKNQLFIQNVHFVVHRSNTSMLYFFHNNSGSDDDDSDGDGEDGDSGGGVGVVDVDSNKKLSTKTAAL